MPFNILIYNWFIYDAHSTLWSYMLYQTGNCNFPTKSKENPALGRWLTSQRADKKSGKIDKANERNLNEIGFVWDRYADKAASGQQETE